MSPTKSIIAVSNPPIASPGITLTLESTGVFLGILVSVSALAGVAIKIISKMNHISISITQLQENLSKYANSVEQIRQLDKKFDIHLQDYVNYKDSTLLALNGAEERIKHTWNKTEKLLEERKADIKELQQFLHKHQDFNIRE